jgi:hypothetical protein
VVGAVAVIVAVSPGFRERFVPVAGAHGRRPSGAD